MPDRPACASCKSAPPGPEERVLSPATKRAVPFCLESPQAVGFFYGECWCGGVAASAQPCVMPVLWPSIVTFVAA